jgi:hypothetical protein
MQHAVNKAYETEKRLVEEKKVLYADLERVSECVRSCVRACVCACVRACLCAWGGGRGGRGGGTTVYLCIF